MKTLQNEIMLITHCLNYFFPDIVNKWLIKYVKDLIILSYLSCNLQCENLNYELHQLTANYC